MFLQQSPTYKCSHATCLSAPAGTFLSWKVSRTCRLVPRLFTHGFALRLSNVGKQRLLARFFLWGFLKFVDLQCIWWRGSYIDLMSRSSRGCQKSIKGCQMLSKVVMWQPLTTFDNCVTSFWWPRNDRVTTARDDLWQSLGAYAPFYMMYKLISDQVLSPRSQYFKSDNFSLSFYTLRLSRMCASY